MSTPGPYQLASDEIVPGRAFTDPAHTAVDFAVMERMRAVLHSTLRALPEPSYAGDIVFPQEPDGRSHRIVVLNRQALLAGTGPCAVVGFFGQRRPDADVGDMDTLDAELIEELRSHPYMLSYSSRELACGGWANLVLLADPEGAKRWRESARHAYAVRQIAPVYYTTIRLHNGALPCGLVSSAILHVRTNYYDFGGGSHWQAVRMGIQQIHA